MDIGLEKLIEMIEQRLGKPFANLLLGLITLAVVGASIHFIWLYLLYPLLVALVDVASWMQATAHGTPVPKVHLPLSIGFVLKIVGIIIALIVTIGVLIAFGSAIRLMISDLRFARGIRGNRLETWSAERSEKALLKNRMRSPWNP